MEINKKKLIDNLKEAFVKAKGEILEKVRLWCKPNAIINAKEVFDFLAVHILDGAYTESIGATFSNTLLFIVTNYFSTDSDGIALHRKRCIALAKLLKFSPDIHKFCLAYFSKVPSPFEIAEAEHCPKKRLQRGKSSESALDIVECCYNFLKSDITFYRHVWNWSTFIQLYCEDTTSNNDPLYRLTCNHILALLTNLTESQLKFLNQNIPIEVIVDFELKHQLQTADQETIDRDGRLDDETEKILLNFSNNSLTNVEGVTLPVFDKTNYKYFATQENDADFEKIVHVESTKINLRSLALGVASGRAVCLAGPVGSGKTTLVEYLAKKTGRIAPKFIDFERKAIKSKSSRKQNNNLNGNTDSNKSKKKRKWQDTEKDEDFVKELNKKAPANGFLRIQLGDQTDSKMLLGQYRCTDVPGEFVWQPGVLTQAVINGYWLLLEDLDACTQDVCTVLTNLLENNYLSVPGFRDCLRITAGFQLFITLRTHRSSTSQVGHFQLLEKYLYTINILPLSRDELCEIICSNYPKLATIAGRIVNVFLNFSSGCHQNEADTSIRTSELNETVDMQGDIVMGSSAKTNEDENVKLATNSGRLVSTRDLLKLCRRSSPTFNVTSTECADFVFKNAVDLFCSHLAQSPAKTELITSIGAHIGINPSKCVALANEYKPDVTVDLSKEIRIGRVVLPRRTADQFAEDTYKRLSAEDVDESSVQKRLKIDAQSHLNIHQQMKRKAPTFSFTRLASCILERIAVAVEQNEPVLLVGETGVGKTSSVQYLSYQTNHKLVVINMNNQSDVSDLVGGFKPVDLSYVMAPLRAEFEALFKQTFNASKNQKFLNNISVCSNQGEFNVLIKLMLKIVETVSKRKPVAADDTTQKDEKVNERWSSLHVKLLKLNSQLRNSINISFAFITGSLVNCIKNGDWVLLDEINLASSETLECLSTILEPDGSIVLLEKGDFVPIKRHPDFRIFACMNPSTDIGKKDLPVGIRNRFTEFFVDELKTENDLIILVGDYLSNTGIQKGKVLSIVKLYLMLLKKAQLDLNDGLGNRPIYSLRTLCRAMIICAKNLCGSVERNLYESFCLSFLTQLDTESHHEVLKLIQEQLIKLSNKKAVLSQSIPKPPGEHLNFEGYWIQQGPKVAQACENYILTDSVKENLRDLARIVSIGKLPVLLQGPTSAGKTSLIEYVAKRSGNYCLRINNHEHTDLQEYIGTYTADETGKLSFKHGVLVQAMKNGYWIILDELNLAPSDILEALNRVLDDNRELFIPETQELIKAHPNFMLFATQNPPGLYGGRKTLSRAFKNRFIELHFSDIPKSELEIILEQRCGIPKSYAKKMVKTMSELQVNRKSTAKGSFTLRDLFRWGNRYTFASSELSKSNYDWNQHLVDEGYLVLSSKIRSEAEVESIETALFNNFRQRIIVDNLFRLHDATSMVTRRILEEVSQHSSYQHIVWTFNMRRMSVLAAKALQFNEPVLLVGQTGCGKTTICQILADIASANLRILNCHMHTEGADFLGGLRPFRGEQSSENDGSRQLFEWANGPLILSMLEGSFFLADEISLAEDSVLERLNCVLEPERTILLAEKGGCSDNFISDKNSEDSNEFVIKANSGFQFLATMNPGGDFGKKELSPALRNRFTEIWCRSIEDKDDLIKIAVHSLKIGYGVLNEPNLEVLLSDIATIIINTVLYIKNNVEKFTYSIRDILAWVQYITKNSDLTQKRSLTMQESIIFGLETMFLDSLEMLPHESLDEIERIRLVVTKFLLNQIKERLQKTLDISSIGTKKGESIDETATTFGISPFFIPANPERTNIHSDFLFTAPTTLKNLFRLLSALSLNKSVLLEGPPGVGKTSLIENLAASIGYQIVRINLCEHTDLADLFGTDQPAENSTFELKSASYNDAPTLGSFVWRDGPLLAALKSPNTWILLDELNLAPQSVLEGLNAILDHRGEIFIPELNKTFKLGTQTRIFASQNPLRQGGGRKGLPQSFLNRFTKVYLRKLESADLCHVVNGKHAIYFESLKHALLNTVSNGTVKQEQTQLSSYFGTTNKNELIPTETNFDLCERLVEFSEKLDRGIHNLEFGYKGGPFEVNLRDILRWCDLISNTQTGFKANFHCDTTSNDRFEAFILTIYEKMKLVYCQRMRTDTDKMYIRNVFAQTFNCNAEALEIKSLDIGLFWNDENIYLSDIRIDKMHNEVNIDSDDQDADGLTAGTIQRSKNTVPIFLSTQREMLKSLAECIIMKKPVLLCGPSDSGKTKVVDVICSITDQYCNVDTIDDTVTGSFQQIDLNRHLEEVAQSIESILVQTIRNLILSQANLRRSSVIKLLQSWEKYNALTTKSNVTTVNTAMSDELIIFKMKLTALDETLATLSLVDNNLSTSAIKVVLKKLQHVVRNADTLNTGGHFEWVDSKFVKALKLGQYICLEHVNLCSSAILDRLNPVFEPNGTLLLSEKGVSTDADNQSECVHQHRNFRAFLTLDPKNGEISRAMRNRCVELSFTKESYSENDLKQLVYENGVKEFYLIDWLLRIHRRLQNITEFTNFNVSHLMKFAFLTNENLRLGTDEIKAIFSSAMEVYVRSSHVDFLGYGLSFQRNKLVQEITDELQAVPTFRKQTFDYENIIIRADNLNSFSLVRLEFEPFVTAVRCLHEQINPEFISTIFQNLHSNFGEIRFELDWTFTEYLLYILYEISSKGDNDLRNVYALKCMEKWLPEKELRQTKGRNEKITLDLKVNKLETQNELLNRTDTSIVAYKEQKQTTISNPSISVVKVKSITELFALNEKLHAEIGAIRLGVNAALPWNQHIFSRLNDYNACDLSTVEQLKLSALLLLQLTVSDIDVSSTTKLSQINAITYSKAVTAKIIPDSLSIDLITHLHPFLVNLRSYLKDVLVECQHIQYHEYADLCCAFLWCDRLQRVAHNKLFEQKTFNDTIIDTLTLHLRWMTKYLLEICDRIQPDQSADSPFAKNLQKLTNYIQTNYHPLNQIRKAFVKTLTNFQPLYEEKQVVHNEVVDTFENATCLVPKLGVFEPEEQIKRFRILMSDEQSGYRKYLHEETILCNDELHWLHDLSIKNAEDENDPICKPFGELKMMKREIDEVDKDLNLESIKIECDQFVTFCNSLDIATVDLSPYKLIIQLLPVLEYYALRSLNIIHRGSSSDFAYNPKFFHQIKSLGLKELLLVHTVSSENYKICEKVWNAICDTITLPGDHGLQRLMEVLPDGFYKTYSSFIRSVISRIQNYTLNATVVNSSVPTTALNCKDDFNQIEKSPQQFVNEPMLSNAILSILFDDYGNFNASGLGDLDIWRSTLKTLSQLIWNNVELMQSGLGFEENTLKSNTVYAQKLLAEIRHIQSQCPEEVENQNFISEFQSLISELEVSVNSAEGFIVGQSVPEIRQSKAYRSAILSSILGSVELNLLTFMPLLDPVEKNRLKKTYVEEDQQHLKQLINAYDFMRAILHYNNLGRRITDTLEIKHLELSAKLEKYSKKCALRPEHCIYASLVKDVNHFLRTCCHPAALLSLLNSISIALKSINRNDISPRSIAQTLTENVKRIELWINNAQRFEYHTLKKYAIYYKDFVVPIETSLSTLKFGLTGLKHILISERDSLCTKGHGQPGRLNDDGALSHILENLISFPNIGGLRILSTDDNVQNDDVSIFTVLDKLDNRDGLHLTLVKSKLYEIQNNVGIAQNISDNHFNGLDAALNIYNQIWKKQEETRRQKAIEEESLYVNKVRCATEDEEEIISNEIQQLFPNHVEDDFGEFIQANTLEQVTKNIPKANNAKKFSDILNDEDTRLMCNAFIEILENYARTYYFNPKPTKEEHCIDFVTPYQSNVKVFYQLVQKYKTCLSSYTDDKFYGGMGLIIGVLLNNYQLLDLSANIPSRRSYNFYKDANIPEIIQTTELLKKLEARVQVELNTWPDHAVLNDIIRIIHRIRSLPANSSVVRFSSGFQILRQKVDEWNSVAHKLNHMRDLEIEIAEFIQRWTRLELQYWRECLSQSFEKLQSKAYRYWFFIYNLLHEYLHQQSGVIACDLTDFKAVEKCLGDDEVNTDAAANAIPKTKVKSSDVISVLKQYIESSNYAEFDLRMRILRAFEFYLQHLNVASGGNARRESLIAIIYNLRLYYQQFSAEINDTIKSIRTPIEKKLKEFVKIESYNKDLSYFSMKNNIARVHRHLHKFLREFETGLNSKIATVFVWKANQTATLTIEQNDKGQKVPYEPNVNYYMIDVKNFIASQTLKQKYTSVLPSLPADETVTTSLLSRADKLFTTSRNIVKQAILHSEFPSLVFNLDTLLADQIETCEYLRKLEVDRTQEKPKQKAQAKQILQQKRKALADTFKTLSTLGLSFRAGVLETSLNGDVVDLKIAPFSMEHMIAAIQKHKKLDQSLAFFDNNLDAYYVKCVFKLKLLQTLLLTPSPELGLPNIERVKGFAMDLFLLVQSQRKYLSKSIIELHAFEQSIAQINDLAEILTSPDVSVDFELLSKRFNAIDGGLCKIISVLEQFDLLLKCVPNDENQQYSVIASSDVTAFNKSSVKYKTITAQVLNVRRQSTDLLRSLQPHRHSKFLNSNSVSVFEKEYVCIKNEINNLSALLLISKCEETTVVAQSLDDLLEYLQSSDDLVFTKATNSPPTQNLENNSYSNIESEIENIIHSILFSMQSIYKKYSIEQETLYDGKGENTAEKVTANESDPSVIDNSALNDEGNEEDFSNIQPNHLKLKIHQELQSDLTTLNISKLITKLSNVLLVLQHTNDGDAQIKLACIQKLATIVPILEQFDLLCKYYLIQQFAAHKVSAKMLSVMLTVFIELGSKGFCIPPDLMQDEEGDSKENDDSKNGEGFGLEDGTGENDVSDKIESEDQLDTAKKPGDDKESDEKEDADCKEEKGIDMSEDFDSKLQDVEKRDANSDESDQSDNEDDMDKQMGETEEGAEKLDDQIWGSDEEKDESEDDDEEMNDEDEGKGSKEEGDSHNDLDSKNDPQQGENEEGLDAANDTQKEKKKKEKDIDQMDEPEVGEDQPNPYHNELEEPPEPEDMDLGNLNLDNQDVDDRDDQNEENPFDIDTMKENMEVDEEAGENEEEPADQETDKLNEQNDFDSDSDEEGETKRDEKDNSEENIDPENPEPESDMQKPGEIEAEEEHANSGDENEPENENEKKEKQNEFQASKDQESKEDNVQAMPEQNEKGTTDQVQMEQTDQQKQENELDEQDTGEDKDGVGQAENDESKTGHQGIADTKETQSNERKRDKPEQQDKRKHGATDEERTINENSRQQKKQLKTVEKISSENRDEPASDEDDSAEKEADEYQHVKDAKKSDKTTMDNATEEQAKKVQHEDLNESDAENDANDVDGADELMDEDQAPDDEENLENVENLVSEKNENDKSKEKKSKGDKNQEKCDTKEEIDVEGDIVPTHNVARKDETSAHLAADILQDTSLPQEPTTTEILDMRKMYENERLSNRLVQPQVEDFERWQSISNKMLPSARELCEQLRLILEPTKCTRLKGDYRTGRRINMKKIIPYIASQFRKDKIWLRRTKPAQRDYKITIAIDDSSSMNYNNSQTLTFQAISMVSQALTLLESGCLSVVSFGQSPQIILNYSDQFDGPKLVNSLKFDQNQSRIAELLDFVRAAATSGLDSAGTDNGLFENLLLILSDGRNIFSEGEQKVRNAVKLARLQRIFIVYIIIDNPENKHSILDIRVPLFAADKKTITMKSYLDTFPFPYYVIVRDMAQVPIVLSDAMRQWFELVSSEQ